MTYAWPRSSIDCDLYLIHHVKHSANTLRCITRFTVRKAMCDGSSMDMAYLLNSHISGNKVRICRPLLPELVRMKDSGKTVTHCLLAEEPSLNFSASLATYLDTAQA
jgi:hypothetical protein